MPKKVLRLQLVLQPVLVAVAQQLIVPAMQTANPFPDQDMSNLGLG
ncbi:MAG: hypothetical protein AWT59_1470 [Candidatus Gallionella acididurans]|uniref:Uncharacterized protein n=1 Tax=Candidatus Gallionella acididurans TaxID=1796491 RepID=A0A139BTY6_9PROT|nr:MAG: hypothetical protein AWT59_1470 [Candidatus Gallionella acididurans]